ncbi:MAG: TadA family conjugal transfer-associated ATPase [Catenulispora sp.]|nr:TadA family conjugal transfer-associated ATPase [Catenulispora sp.]
MPSVPPAPAPLDRVRLSPALVDRVRSRLATPPVRIDTQAILAALRAEGCMLDGRDLRAAAYQVRSELTGAGVLDRYLADPEVTDILVNGPDAVWVERAGRLSRAEVRFPDETAVRRLAQRLAAHAGRRLDDAAPYVDGVLPDGARLHAVLPPVAVRGTLISLRVPPRRAFTLERLTASGMASEQGARLLRAIASARLSYLVTGGTGSGKTTLLGTLLGLVPPSERIVVAEECAEVVVDHPHVARMQCRLANQENRGAVNLRTLVRQALRMRPDRVVVGEVRGPEILELLAAMNTGHDGCAATLHANGPKDVVARIEALAAPAGLERGALHAQLASAVQVVVHLVREEGRRRLGSIGVIDRSFNETEVLPAVAFDPAGRATFGPGADRLSLLLNMEIRAGQDAAHRSPESDLADGLEKLDGWPEALAAADRLLPVLTEASADGGSDADEPFVADYGPPAARQGGRP